MTESQRKAMEQLISALENHCGNYKLDDAGERRHDAAIKAGMSALAEPAPEPVNPDLLVTSIMLDVVPGEDGSGAEIYAKSAKDVVNKLTELSAELEEWQLGIRKFQDQVCEPAPEPVDFDAAFDSVNWDEWRHRPIRELVRELHKVTTPEPAPVPLLTDEEIALMWVGEAFVITSHESCYVRGVKRGEQVVRQKAGL